MKLQLPWYQAKKYFYFSWPAMKAPPPVVCDKKVSQMSSSARGSSWSKNHPISPPFQLRGRKHGWAEFILLEFQRLRLAIIIPYLSLLGISPSISIRTMGWLRLLPWLVGLLFTFVGHKHVFLQEPFQDFCQFHCPFHGEEVWFGFKS